MAIDVRIMDQAVAWAVKTGDPSFEDWEGFTAWLEADPDHAAAYDLIASGVTAAAETLAAVPQPANDLEPAGFTRRRWLGGALAASLAVILALGVWQMQPQGYTVETAPGETRMIALADGDRIALAGGSRIELDHGDPRRATLERGQALFTIRHDPARPFRLDVGEDELVDIGTVFDVKLSGTTTTVAVSEGAVAFNPRAQNVRIDPGHVLSSEAGSAEYTLGPISADQVGEWREGRLTFQDATLASVADDLSRATGVTFMVAPGAAGRRISGSLLVDPVRADPRGVGPLLGVNVSPQGEAWVIEAR